MIRLNSFFKVKDNKREEFLAMAKELVAKSREEEGNILYSLAEDVYDPCSMLFVETWQDAPSLKAHSETEHFTRIVPLLKALTENGMHLERFEF